ncbi:hypothetical protein [Nocardioides panaciterrulae]|uniref:HK97 gp10 family phage protein n=1 Tax=Nocardioides panaciterrulae TaxID=661492 RepID=A0A7Y9JD55_9ACTN|nr:hypothetical protein [Nocardioides panaciterrulae]NYD43932.1 hypothetical protein [Nocardioides panaciterrulae]NYD44001.1 hypothetical protein [Nocardioides panaciterrulae]
MVRALLEIGLEVNDLKDAFSTIAAEGARLASSYAPHRSGTLAGDVRGNRARSSAHVAAGRASVPYAGPINYGWAKHHIAANGFMQRADKAWQPFALKRLEQEINAQITRRGLR